VSAVYVDVFVEPDDAITIRPSASGGSLVVKIGRDAQLFFESTADLAQLNIAIDEHLAASQVSAAEIRMMDEHVADVERRRAEGEPE
jgi:hypothetical protein